MEDPDYFNSHMRRIRDLGPASALPCTDCGNPARHWSYDHGDPEERSTPNPKTGSLLVYSMKNEHYVPRCATCHARHDR
jgi:thymidine kinase